METEHLTPRPTSPVSWLAWRETRAVAALALMATISIVWFGRSYAEPCLDDPCARTQVGLTLNPPIQ